MGIEIDPATGAPIVTPKATTADFIPKTDVPNDSNTGDTEGENAKDENPPATSDEPPAVDSNIADGDSSKDNDSVDASSVAAIEESPVKSPKEILNDKVMAILAEYNNVEADIPYGHEYWQLRNQMLAFRR